MRGKFAAMLFLILALAPICHAITASMGNARMVLRPEVKEGEIVTIDKYILINNVNNVSIKVTLKPDGSYEKIIEIHEPEITLDPGQSQEVPFTITLRSGGDYAGKILVSFSIAEPTAKQSNIGLASNIIILAEGPKNDYYYEDFYHSINASGNLTDVLENLGDDNSNTTTINIGVNETAEDNLPEPDLTADTSDNSAGERANPVVGVIILVFFVIVGCIAVFIYLKRNNK